MILDPLYATSLFNCSIVLFFRITRDGFITEWFFARIRSSSDQTFQNFLIACDYCVLEVTKCHELTESLILTQTIYPAL